MADEYLNLTINSERDWIAHTGPNLMLFLLVLTLTIYHSTIFDDVPAGFTAMDSWRDDLKEA